jgi:hypothetical protein
MNSTKWPSLTVLLLFLLFVCVWWIVISVNGAAPRAPDLQEQWIAVGVVLIALCAVSGLFVNGRVDGILIDDRNRISLARLQWVAWFTVLLSAYFVGAVVNLKSGVPYKFPMMEPHLFGLIGLASGSTVVSNLIVDSKKSAPGVASTAPVAPVAAVAATPAGAPAVDAVPEVPGNVGKIDINADPKQASWQDLYCGEEMANRDVVDVSRLQQLITTVLLVTIYTGLLWKAFGAASTNGVLSEMPPVSDDFLGLLGVSHAGYLAYKATPKT